MSILFEGANIGKMHLKNRFVMSAVPDGCSNLESRKKRFAALAEGGVALIITEALADNEVERIEGSAAAVHENNGKFAVQVGSTRSQGITFCRPGNDNVAVSELLKDNPVFNSFIPWGPHHQATEAEIWEIIEMYARTAARAKELGADAVEMHSAHGSLLSQFLSPITNKRTDRWGGSIENRTRIHRGILDATRKRTGTDFPVLIKVGVEDAFENGLKAEEGIIIAQKIASYGYDALEISMGLVDWTFKDYSKRPQRMNIRNEKDEAYFGTWCGKIRKTIDKPTIMTGGMRSFEVSEQKVLNQETDFIGMCRPFIREIGLVNRWASGDRKRATCISCNGCYQVLIKGLPIACALDSK